MCVLKMSVKGLMMMYGYSVSFVYRCRPRSRKDLSISNYNETTTTSQYIHLTATTLGNGTFEIYHCSSEHNETQIDTLDDARVLEGVSNAIIPPLMFSLIVSGLVVMVYNVVPGVRRHPNLLIYIKAWADLLWCVFTAVPAVALASGDKCFCETDAGHFVAFVTEFSLATSILCLLMLSVDLVLNSRSPFANFKNNLRCYTIWIPIGALGLAVALVSSGNIGLYLLGFCLTPYYQNRVTNPHLMIAAIPIAICGLFQIASLYYASGKLSFLRNRMMHSDKHRNDIWGRRNKSIWTSIYYTVTYLVTWTLIAICYIILSQVSSVSDEEVRAGYSDIDVRNLGYATACLYALQPCPIAILWIILYGGPIKVKFRSILGYGKKKTGGAHDEENIDDLSPQLNEALREEIVEYLKFGFDALFNTEFEKTRDPHKDQITIHIDPSEALRDDDDDDVDSKRNSVTSQMSNWWSGKDHHHHHHHHTNSTSSTPVSTTTTTTMNAAKMTHNTTPTLQVYRDSVYQPPETPDIPSSVSDDTTAKPKSTEMKDVVVVVKELDGDEEEKEGKEEKTSSRKSPAKMLRVDDKAVDESSVMMPQKLNKTASPSMLRRHLSAAGDDGLLEDILITAGGTSNTRSHVVFQEKLTSIFQDFRKKLGIEKTFRSEMRQISAGMETNGRSGSFFFFTQRKLFCLKTMSKKEFEVLTRLVKPAEGSGVVPYTEYVLANRKTLIVRILGAYKLTMNDYGNSLYLYCMANIFPPPKKGVVLGEKYDIKGSAGEGPPLCAGPILYRRSLPPKPGTLSRCKYCGQKFYVRNNQKDESDFGVEVVYWPEQLRRLRKPDMVEYNFSEATRLRVRLEHSKNRRSSSLRRNISGIRTSASERSLGSNNSKKKLRKSSSSSSVKKIDHIMLNSVESNHSSSSTALRRIGSEFIRRIPSSDIESYAPAPIAPTDWRQSTLVGQTTEEEREVLVDVSSGFRFALRPEVMKKARVVWVTNLMGSPIPETKTSSADSPLMSIGSSFGGDDSMSRSFSNGYHTISFHFDTTQQDDSKVEEWLKAEVTTKHPTANPQFEYFQNKTYGIFRIAVEDLVKLDKRRRNSQLQGTRSEIVTLRFSTIRPSRCPSHRRHDPVRDMLDGDLTQSVILAPKIRDNIVTQISDDAMFLSQHGIMDYSLLLGVQQQTNINEDDSMVVAMGNLRKKTGLEINCCTSHYAFSQTYYMGIIDLLRIYDRAKVIENFNKRILCCRGERISAVPPDKYRSYFVDFLSNTVFPPLSRRHRRRMIRTHSKGHQIAVAESWKRQRKKGDISVKVGADTKK